MSADVTSRWRKARKTRKAQFTIFALLGMVMVIAFSFALYARSITIQTQLQQEASLVLSQKLETTPITLYVTRCLDEASKDAFSLAALQGGVIYDTQGGLTPFDPAGNGTSWFSTYVPEYNRTVYVPYWIKQQKNGSCVEPALPNYPFNNTFASSWTRMFASRDGENCAAQMDDYAGSFFGQLTLPKLCTASGPNSRIFNVSICGRGFYGIEQTVQQQLEATIAHRLMTCVNFSLFERDFGNNITVVNEPEVNVTFSKKGGSSIAAQYPFTIFIRGKVPVVKMVSFQVSSDIAFKEIYTFIATLANNDVQAFNFNPLTEFSAVSDFAQLPHSADTSLNREYAVCAECAGQDRGSYADILQIIDNRTLINGRPLIFNIAIQNRWPALDYVHETPAGEKIDMVRREGDVIEMRPYGYDPDDGTLTYIYAGWKETQDAYFDYDACARDAACSENPAPYIITLYGAQPKNWSGSELFKTSRQFASYRTNSSDAGIHQVAIKVMKRGNLVDEQTVTLFVFDRPKAIARGKSLYADVPDSEASIEDPYELSGALSTASIFGHGTRSRFIWNDTLLTNSMVIDTAQASIPVPWETWGGVGPEGFRLDINTIRDHFNFSVPRLFDAVKDAVQHNITLAVEERLPDNTIISSNGAGAPASFAVNVSQCLIHSDANANPAWPYVKITDDASVLALPFREVYLDPDEGQLTDPQMLQGTHTCCNSGSDDPAAKGQYLDPSTVCRDETVYGSADALKSLSAVPGLKARYDFAYNRDLWWSSLSSTEQNDHWKMQYNGQNPYDPASKDYRNDIFAQQLTRQCSGDRGNICNGAVKQDWSVVQACQDHGDLASLRVCSGPHDDIVRTAASAATCANYAIGENFALTYLHEPVLGARADTPKRSNVGTSDGYDADVHSPFLCKGYCDGNGGCKATLAQDCMCSTGTNCDLANVKTITGPSGGQCVTAGLWCNSDCEGNAAADIASKQAACNCKYNNIPLSTSSCGVGNQDCWAGTSCCEGSATFQASADTGCVGGRYYAGKDSSPKICEWVTHATDHWKRKKDSTNECCTATDTFEGDDGQGCCVSGAALPEQAKAGSNFICTSGSDLQYCGSANPAPFGTKANIGDCILGIIAPPSPQAKNYACTASGWVPTAACTF